MHSRGLETHFKVVLVSPQFAGLNAVKRHQKVYATLGGLMGEFHALALHTFTPEGGARLRCRPRRPAAAGASTTYPETASVAAGAEPALLR